MGNSEWQNTAVLIIVFVLVLAITALFTIIIIVSGPRPDYEAMAELEIAGGTREVLSAAADLLERRETKDLIWLICLIATGVAGYQTGRLRELKQLR